MSLVARNHKTVLCTNFIKSGNCRFGLTCSFAHGDNELRKESDPQVHVSRESSRAAKLSTPHPSKSMPSAPNGAPKPMTTKPPGMPDNIWAAKQKRANKEDAEKKSLEVCRVAAVKAAMDDDKKASASMYSDFGLSKLSISN
jgi:hypothetical protein